MPKDIDTVVFILRQSPDWAGLDRDYSAGREIDPIRFKPPGFLQGFPENIEECIRTWNEVLPINFFRCRQILKNIAVDLLRKVNNAIILSEQDATELPFRLGDHNFLLFFLDDDDWFAPDTFEQVSSLKIEQNEIAVFPLVRFDMDTYTFARQFEPSSIIIGSRKQFHFRFQTNNYGIGSELALTDYQLQFMDHVTASRYADSLDIQDRYFDVLISATNKTPCSASKLLDLVADSHKYKKYIRNYVENLQGLTIPAEMSWAIPALDETIALFSTLLQRCGGEAVHQGANPT